MNSLTAFLLSNYLLYPYFIIFLVIITIRILCFKEISINTIWFSETGIVSHYAIENILQLKHDIKKSGFNKNYKIYFWTDVARLDKQVLNLFKKNKIIVSDYKILGAEIVDPITQLLNLGNVNNKTFYVLASDLLRLYLLLKYFPSRNLHHYNCYIDCNDIEIKAIPHPRVFNNISFLAFHFVRFNFSQHAIFKTLVPENNLTNLMLTNDVIVAKNKKSNFPLFEKIYATYYANFSKKRDKDTITLLKLTCEAMQILDDELVRVIIFLCTHMITVLQVQQSYPLKVALMDFSSDKITKTPLPGIEDVSDFIFFNRDYDKGFTCVLRANRTTSLSTSISEGYREWWYQLFIERYKSPYRVQKYPFL